MWCPGNPVSDENQVPAVQNVHRKSVGRTSLKALTGQHLAVLDPNTLVNKRSSLSQTSSHTTPMSKESTRVSFGTPVSVWIDPCCNNSLTERSRIEANTSKHLTSCSHLEKVVSCDSNPLPAGPENCNQSHESLDVNLLSQPIDMFKSQTASSEDSYRRQVNKVADGLLRECYKLMNLPPTITTCELQELQTSTILEDDTCQMAKLDEPYSCADAPAVLTPEGPLKQNTEPDNVLLENPESNCEDNITLHSPKHEIVFPLMRNDSHLEDLLLAGGELDGVEVVSEPNVMSANVNFEVDPRLEGDSEQSSFPVIDVLSEVTGIIENWTLSIKDNEDYYQNEPADDEGDIKGFPQVETLALSPLGSVMGDIKEIQLLSGSPEIFDPIFLNNSERSFTDTLHLEDSVFKELTLHDPERSSFTLKHYSSGTRANQCCTPIDGETTALVQAEGHYTPITDTQRFSPISDIDKLCQSNPSIDQNVMKNTPFTECCPTPIMPINSKVHEIPLLSKGIFKNITPRMFVSAHEAGTSMTPVSTSEGVTWTTPIMLLNKSMNTSGDFIVKGGKSAKDNASETDSVLWNFSREALHNASRDELMDRLEGTLIVVEVLSRQLQGWQQSNVSSKPSEQRECSTQTSVTYTSTEEQYYHNLYLKTLHRLQSMQCSREQENALHQHLKEATEALTSHKNEASSMFEFAKSQHEMTQKDRADLQQNMSHCRKLLTDHMNILEKISQRLQDNLLQRDEMRARMEKAIQAKEAADQCLQDLEIHSSAVITQLRQDLESERELCESVKEVYEQQHFFNEELAEFVHRALYVCSEEDENQTQLQRQCSHARELMSRHWLLFEVMKEKTQSILEECEEIKRERDMAVLENEKVHSEIERIDFYNEQMKLENSRLGAELESLMERLCTLESEIEQLKEDNSELAELLYAKDSSMKLLEKELNEATVRGQQYQDRNKHLTSQVVPSLKRDLSDALSQKQALQEQLERLAKEYASQIVCYTESLEFLEQENSVCREQVSETESQLKTHHLTVLERNFLCENLKDTIQELQKKVSTLQEKLSRSQEDAQRRIMKLSKEISDSSTEVSKIKSHMLELIEKLRAYTKTEVVESLPGSQTPGQSMVLSMDEELTTNISTADSENQREGIWSKTSAFTVVLPLTSLSADTPQEKLSDVVRELSNIVSDVIITTSSAMEEKQQIIQDLNLEISSLKESLKSQRFCHMSEMRNLQEELSNLERRNTSLDKKLNSKEKCISELQEVVNQQEQKILEQFSQVKESGALIQENAELQLSLKVCEKEVDVLKQELAQNSKEAARSWIKEKLLLHKDVTTLRLKLVDLESSKSEAIQRLLRHKDILKTNLMHSEAEVRKLDDIIVKIRQVLVSIPDVVNNCDKLSHLMEFLN
ncbi:sperm-associated antigen 5 [Hyla sarda]|uniref:sperm-associated antigen 5 n=1 Tax=Hyla sarda TaxID=327740 RepID=UPI0024C3D25F|nr:sperm-associated antigen 5 [Hyla sarda]XP_056415072.1 sperm-associated antigen 5 [Hyla sarda]XP_056415073.1 sperm-associated antigen 5 [Hyla sarda]XP_056415075.1 sperm-associated antigen 5 [Hyla sarda]